MFYTVNEKISDPRITFYGTVVDEYSQGIEGAAVEWSTSRDGGLGRIWSGTTFTNESGAFYPGPKRMRGTSLTIHKVSKEGHQTIYKPRTYRYYKDTEQRPPGPYKSTTFLLRKK